MTFPFISSVFFPPLFSLSLFFSDLFFKCVHNRVEKHSLGAIVGSFVVKGVVVTIFIQLATSSTLHSVDAVMWGKMMTMMKKVEEKIKGPRKKSN